MSAQFTVTNVVNICNVYMAPCDPEEEKTDQAVSGDEKVDPERERSITNAKSLIELANLDNLTDIDTDDADTDMVKENRIPIKVHYTAMVRQIIGLGFHGNAFATRIGGISGLITDWDYCPEGLPTRRS